MKIRIFCSVPSRRTYLPECQRWTETRASTSDNTPAHWSAILDVDNIIILDVNGKCSLREVRCACLVLLNCFSEFAIYLLNCLLRTCRLILLNEWALIIGGGIANFTNVADSFKDIIKALAEHHTRLIEHKVSIFVRRGGPNYQEGLA